MEIKLSLAQRSKKSDIFTIIDLDDYEKIAAFSWHLGSGYARRRSIIDGKKKVIYLHRFILAAPDDLLVDHINGNSLDNRRCNIRLCDDFQNSWNSAKQYNAKSKYKGVSKHRDIWRARIGIMGETVELGYFETQEDAAKAYDKAAIVYYKEFAKLNFVALPTTDSEG